MTSPYPIFTELFTGSASTDGSFFYVNYLKNYKVTTTPPFRSPEIEQYQLSNNTKLNPESTGQFTFFPYTIPSDPIIFTFSASSASPAAIEGFKLQATVDDIPTLTQEMGFLVEVDGNSKFFGLNTNDYFWRNLTNSPYANDPKLRNIIIKNINIDSNDWQGLGVKFFDKVMVTPINLNQFKITYGLAEIYTPIKTSQPTIATTPVVPLQWRSCQDGKVYNGYPPTGYVSQSFSGGGICWRVDGGIEFIPPLQEYIFKYVRNSQQYPRSISFQVANTSIANGFIVRFNTNPEITVTPSVLTIAPTKKNIVNIDVLPSLYNKLGDGITEFKLDVEIQRV